MSKLRICFVTTAGLGMHKGWKALKVLEEWQAKSNCAAKGFALPTNRLDRLVHLYGLFKNTLIRGQRAYLFVGRERRDLAQAKSYYRAQLSRWGFPRKGKKSAGPMPPPNGGYALPINAQPEGIFIPSVAPGPVPVTANSTTFADYAQTINHALHMEDFDGPPHV
jgi:hypothetical protein